MKLRDMSDEEWIAWGTAEDAARKADLAEWIACRLSYEEMILRARNRRAAVGANYADAADAVRAAQHVANS